MITLLFAAALVAAPTPKPATNTKCPVMGEKINPAKSPKAVVRGQEYFLCCKGCDKKLQADPDKYLEKDGTPKNAKK
jgi:YHS domain-containing protein